MAAGSDRPPPFSPISRPSGRLEGLRAHIRAIEQGGRPPADGVPLGIAAIDRRLPGGGIMPGALHEVIAGDAAAGAATAFVAALLGRLIRRGEGKALWCLRPSAIDSGEIYGPGLARFGLEPDRLLALRGRRDADVLWAMEEALHCRELTTVLGEVDRITLTESRRLQLAAEASGGTALLLRPAHAGLAPSASATCWRVSPAPSLPCDPAEGGGEPGAERWRAELVRSRGGASGTWLVEWCDETRDLALSAAVRDRPAGPRRAAAQG